MRDLRRGTAWLGGAQAGRLMLQSATFVLIARALGAHGFGAFAASLALVSVLSPFAALGAGNLLVMHVARRPESFRAQWGAVLLMVPVAGLPLLAACVGLGAVVLPVPVELVLLVGVAELFCSRLAELAGQAFQGFERARAVALVTMIQPALRLAAAAIFCVLGSTSPVEWGAFYLGGTVIAALAGLVAVTVALGFPRFERHAVTRTARQGAWFALAQSSANVYTDIDKTMLARLGTLSAAGIYAVAYRMTAMAFTPIAGMLVATYARFFKRGEAGIEGSRRFAIELLPAAALYGLGAGAVLVAIAPLLPHILGPDYKSAQGALIWLAPLPLIQAFYYLAGDALTGAGYQRTRTVTQLVAAGANVLLCIVLIPAYGWRGAAAATLVTLGGLAVAMWAAVAIVSGRERHGDTGPRLAGLQA